MENETLKQHELVKRPVAELKLWELNPRRITDEAYQKLKAKMLRLGIYKPLITTADGTVIGGNMRLRVLQELKVAEAWCSLVDETNEAMLIEIAISDNESDGSWVEEELGLLLEGKPIDLSLYTVQLGKPITLSRLMGQEDDPNETINTGALAEKFIVPPFSVLDARQGYWRERKAWWHDQGITSEEGRSDVGSITDSAQEGLNKIGNLNFSTGTSIFDPVLCEIAYRWFCPNGGSVLDPFAGGSVRGIVAAKLGLQYVGVDLSEKQVAANQRQASNMELEPQPVWVQGDSMQLENLVDGEYDFVFSCPPYGSLEKYSEDPNDLSNQSVDEFAMNYNSIIIEACKKLKNDRFACFVVGDYRDSKGFYSNFVSATIDNFHSAGMQLYNEAILVTPVGSLPMRIQQSFGVYRKLGKTHQNVLVFYKGDPKKVKDNYKVVENLEKALDIVQ